MSDHTELSERFTNMSVTAATRAPLYARLSASIAHDEEVARLLEAAPEPQRLPVLLFAAVHHLLLAGHGAELASYYPNLCRRPAAGDPYPAFRSFVLNHATQLTEVIASRSTQTNEVGRCSLVLPALGMLYEERGPLALVDVGASAGLNLLLHHYSYEFMPGGSVGGASTVRLRCSTRGSVPVPAAMPLIAAAIGIDRDPIDIFDDEAVRWLQACVWPDQGDRLALLQAAIDLARLAPPDVRQGDAVEDLTSTVAEASTAGHPVVINSWVLNYLTVRERTRYVTTLDACGNERDLSWVIIESPVQTRGLPVPSTPDDEHLTMVSLATWRHGRRSVRRLATAHPHGFWMHWELPV